MTFNPLAATGILFGANVASSVHPVVTGSCFLFRSDRVILTASHCVPTGYDFFRARFPWQRLDRHVTEVRRHPTADLALLICEGEETWQDNGYPLHAFWDGVDNIGLGEDAFAYGFPAVGEPVVGDMYPPRLFKTHYQRIFKYVSPSGLRYVASELSVPAPGGLSGSPLFRPGAEQMVTGLVTANVESYSLTDSIEEVDDDGRIYRHEARKVVSYGIALMLTGVADWLNDNTQHGPGRNGWVLQGGGV